MMRHHQPELAFPSASVHIQRCFPISLQNFPISGSLVCSWVPHVDLRRPFPTGIKRSGHVTASVEVTSALRRYVLQHPQLRTQADCAANRMWEGCKEDVKGCLEKARKSVERACEECQNSVGTARVKRVRPQCGNSMGRQREVSLNLKTASEECGSSVGRCNDCVGAARGQRVGRVWKECGNKVWEERGKRVGTKWEQHERRVWGECGYSVGSALKVCGNSMGAVWDQPAKANSFPISRCARSGMSGTEIA
eukprot:3896553-Rhodomonas_salina.1